MKKLISILLVLAMVLALAPMAFASEEAVADEPQVVKEEPVIEAEEPVIDEPAQDGVDEYPLWVGGVQVTSANASDILGNGTASYRRATKTLTFSGLTGFTDYYVLNDDEHYGVYTTEDLTVTGTASFTIKETGGTSYGIVSTGVLTVAGGADLTISVWNYALEGRKGVIINGGRINVTGRSGRGISATGGQGLVVNGGVINASSGCFAIDAQASKITVNGGAVTATTTGSGSYTGIRLLSSGSITVNSGVLDVTNTADGKALDYSEHVTYASTHEIAEGSLDGSHFRIAPKPQTVLVTFVCNGGKIKTGTGRFTEYDTSFKIKATVGQPYGSWLEPTRDGYTFVGWYTESSGGTQVTADTVCTRSTDHYLYAHWTKNEEPEPAEKPTLTISADAKKATITGSFDGLFARVALVIDNNGVSGLYITQATINADGTILIPEFKVPGLKVKGVNVTLVSTLADIQSTTPKVEATATKMLGT